MSFSGWSLKSLIIRQAVIRKLVHPIGTLDIWEGLADSSRYRPEASNLLWGLPDTLDPRYLKDTQKEVIYRLVDLSHNRSYLRGFVIRSESNRWHHFYPSPEFIMGGLVSWREEV